MLCKPQHFEINCNFQSKLTVKPTFLPSQNHVFHPNYLKDSNFLPLPLKGYKKDGKFHKKNGNSTIIIEKLSNSEPDPQCSTIRVDPGNRENSGIVTVFREKVMHGRCSMKCREILRALENVSDLDEALKPWEGRIGNKEMRIILKEQVSVERSLAVFEWFKEGYELDVVHYNVMLRIVGKARKWDEVERLWGEMRRNGIKPVNSTYGTVIDVYGKGGCVEEAVGWLRRMDEQGLVPDEVTMGVVVQMYKKAGEFQKAEEFWVAWYGRGRRMKLYTYNTLIDMYGKAGKICEMTGIFEKMVRDGVVPDIVTFNTMIHSYGNVGMIEEVNRMMRMMEECRRCPDILTFNILISIYVKRDDIGLAYRCFVKMKETCFEQRDTVSYRMLLSAFSVRKMVVEAERLVSEMLKMGLEIDEYMQTCMIRMYIEANLLDKSWSWFEHFHSGGNMSSECYSANIDAYGERGYLNEAEKVFLCCQERNRIGVIEFNVMIKAYCICKEYVKACKLFDSMEKRGFLPNRCTYITLIQSLAAADLPHIAKPYLLKMQEAGLVTDCVPYTALISSFAKLGQLELAESLYREMIGYNVHPDVYLFGALINASAETGNVAAAASYINALYEAGLSLNEVICNSLIKLCTKVGLLDKAKETYQLLQSFEMGPNSYSSNCMIDLYTKRSMVQEAEEIFNDMRRNGKANEFSFAMMLCMYKRIGRLKEAIEIAERMQELGLLTDLLSYNNVLSLFAAVGKFQEAMHLFKEMIKLEIEPDDFSFKSLALVLVKSGVGNQAVATLEVARKKDSLSSVQAWLAALTSAVSSDSYGDYDYD